ncbi:MULTISPECIES: TetR/AcrR family transcriptional regulator [Micrococcaceae]|jgi:AcrR family transcriptional regulator|uniref:TetR/AcrR family transcriptional regulator n=1 Tax=Micrococcaceae TaxID=1268 RepID=UPI0021488125|nr:TetR family transcriptional regulator C-terminal domain-containing protein [Paenarthrobacter sp. UW852]MCR1161569.1 TetR family transcriptional regulator C-terminal domain-containing protein [Paenarthrobacter sp. UW852]
MSSTPQKRAVRKSPAERATEITEAARQIALETGLTALTLRNVAARVGVASGLVAHYQPNMDALVSNTFATIVAAETQEIAALLSQLPGPSERLSLLVDTLLDNSRLDVTAIWVEAWTLGRRNEALAASVREQMDAWQKVFQGVVEDGNASGAFNVSDAAAVAWQILGMVDGLNAQALVRWDGVNDRGSHLARAVEGMVGAASGSLVRQPSVQGARDRSPLP